MDGQCVVQESCTTVLKRLSLIERLLLATPRPSQEGSLVNKSLVRASLSRVSLGRDTERITSRVMEVLDTWTDNVSCKSRARLSSRDSL